MKKTTFLLMILISYAGFATPTLDKTKSSSSAFNVISFEAESGFTYKGASVQNCGSCSNSSRVGNIGGPSADSGYFTSIVSVPTAGVYTLTFSYSSGEDRAIFIGANGGSATSSTVNSGGWDTIATATTQVTLNAGTNTIKFFNNNWYAPNVDKFDLLLLTAAPPCVTCMGPFEAESGIVVAPATIQSCNTCSGGQQVGDMGFGAVDRFFTTAVEVPTAGIYKMYVSFSSGSPRSIFVSSNNGTPVEASCHSIDWGVVFVKEMQITLSQGTNTLKFYNPNDWAPNIDKFRLELFEALSTDSNSIRFLTAYPNPTNSKWIINNQNAEHLTIELFDVLGKKVSIQNSNNTEISVDASYLTNGIYFAKINSGNDVKTLKLIKN